MDNGNGVVKLEISLFPDGKISVNGPLENKIFCLGLIEMAKDAIYKYKPGPVNLLPPNLLNHLGPKGSS